MPFISIGAEGSDDFLADGSAIVAVDGSDDVADDGSDGLVTVPNKTINRSLFYQQEEVEVSRDSAKPPSDW